MIAMVVFGIFGWVAFLILLFFYYSNNKAKYEADKLREQLTELEKRQETTLCCLLDGGVRDIYYRSELAEVAKKLLAMSQLDYKSPPNHN